MDGFRMIFFFWKHGSRKTHQWRKKSGREGGLEPSTFIHPSIPSACPIGSWGGWSLSWVIGRKTPWKGGQSIPGMTNTQTFIFTLTHSLQFTCPVHLWIVRETLRKPTLARREQTQRKAFWCSWDTNIFFNYCFRNVGVGGFSFLLL